MCIPDVTPVWLSIPYHAFAERSVTYRCHLTRSWSECTGALKCWTFTMNVADVAILLFRPSMTYLYASPIASTSSTFYMYTIFRKHTLYLHLHLSSGDLWPTSYLCYCTLTHCQACISDEVWCYVEGHVFGSIWTGALLMQALNTHLTQLQAHRLGKESPLPCHPPSIRSTGERKDREFSFKQWNVVGRARAAQLGRTRTDLG